MATIVRYYPGGYIAGGAQGNRAEQWTNATQPGDPTPAGYTAWDTNGTITATSVLTPAQVTQLAAIDTDATTNNNRGTLTTQAQNALTANRTYLGIASPSNAQVTAQVRALTQQVQALIRFALNQFDGTN